MATKTLARLSKCCGGQGQFLKQKPSPAIVYVLADNGQCCGQMNGRWTSTVPLAEDTASLASSVGKAKPFSEMPGEKGYPLIGTVLEGAKYVGGNILKLWGKRFHVYGPIWKEKSMGMLVVGMKDPEDAKELLRNEGEHPQRFEFVPWLHYREARNIEMGVLLSDGAKWHRQRRAADKYLLKPVNVASYNAALNQTSKQVMENMVRAQTVYGHGKRVPRVQEHLFRWSLESIGLILYDKQLGCLTKGISKETESFVQSTHSMFVDAEPLFLLPISLGKIFYRKSYKKFMSSMDTVFEVATKHIDAKMDEIEEKAGKNEKASGLLAYLATEELPLKEIYATITDLMSAAVDTTSTTMQWVLYLLAHNPKVQDKLHEELKHVLPEADELHDDIDITNQNLQQLPYLRAVIKETMRLYPAAAGVNRITSKDLILGGYEVPKGTIVFFSTFHAGREEKYFKHAESFQPERWLRETGARDAINPFAVLPFGFGTRACLGRRLAELELHLLLAQLARKFKIYPGYAKDVKINQRMLLYPDKSVDIQLKPWRVAKDADQCKRDPCLAQNNR